MNKESQNHRPAWMLERAEILLRACQQIQTWHAEGMPVAEALRRLVKTLAGRTYKRASGKALGCSYNTLRRVFYRWRKQGNAALELHYSPTVFSDLKPATIRQFLRFAVQPGVTSFLTAYGLLMARYRTQGRKLHAYQTILKVIDARSRERIRREHQRRKAAARAERAFSRFTQTLLKRPSRQL